MSRHTWLTRPTEEKAERLLFAFDQAIAYGATCCLSVIGWSLAFAAWLCLTRR